MQQRSLASRLPRQPFCLTGARGVGKTTMLKDFASGFSNWIHLDLETEADRRIFSRREGAGEVLKAISFLKGKELRGKGTLIVLDEIARCPEAIRWALGQADGWTSGQADGRTGGQADNPLVVAISSVMTTEIETMIGPVKSDFLHFRLHPLSFEEFLNALDDQAALEAFREIPVPYYAHEKLLHYFHLYTLLGGMPEIVSAYAANRRLTGMGHLYDRQERRFIESLTDVTRSSKSRELALEVLRNAYPYAASRISFRRFGNMDKGSREIARALKTLESVFFLRLVYPVIKPTLPLSPDMRRFPRLHLVDSGLVGHFSGIRKTIYETKDMSAVFRGQMARQVVSQEIFSTGPATTAPAFWVRDKLQSSASVDFVIPFGELLIPLVIRSGEAGSLRSLHRFMETSIHPYAIRLCSDKPGIRQAVTTRGRKFYLLSLPYFLAGKIGEYFRSFIRMTDSNGNIAKW